MGARRLLDLDILVVVSAAICLAFGVWGAARHQLREYFAEYFATHIASIMWIDTALLVLMGLMTLLLIAAGSRS